MLWVCRHIRPCVNVLILGTEFVKYIFGLLYPFPNNRPQGPKKLVFLIFKCWAFIGLIFEYNSIAVKLVQEYRGTPLLTCCCHIMLLTWKPFIFDMKKIEWGYPNWDTFYKFLTQHMKKFKLRHVVFYGSLWSTCMLSSVKNIHMLQLCLSLCTCSVTHLYMFNSWKFRSSLFFGCEVWTYWN